MVFEEDTINDEKTKVSEEEDGESEAGLRPSPYAVLPSVDGRLG